MTMVYSLERNLLSSLIVISQFAFANPNSSLTFQFTGRNAFIGVGFADRSDSFDLNVALQDHFNYVKKEIALEKEKEEPKQSLDLGFKEGQTIKINMRITVSSFVGVTHFIMKRGR